MYRWATLIMALILAGCTAEVGQQQGEIDPEKQYLFPEVSAPSEEETEISADGEALAEERCEDTDGGMDIHTKGVTTVNKGGSDEWAKEDFCFDSRTLYEYYCEGGALTHEVIKCPCSNGVCEPILDYTECVDSDGGNDKHVKGEITLIKHYTDGEIVEEHPVEDHCISETGLIEYFCGEDGNFRKYTYTCLYCSNGVCTK